MVTTAIPCTKSQRLIELKFAQAELSSLQSFQSQLQRERDLQRLHEVTGVSDHDLLARLQAAGFNADNIHALSWLPIAAVAWASPGVSKDEAQAAQLVNLYWLMCGHPASRRLFKSWLTHKPADYLLDLWEEYVRHQTSGDSRHEQQQTGQAILYVASKVAKASGGMLGWGQISPAEQRVLDRICSAYGLS